MVTSGNNSISKFAGMRQLSVVQIDHFHSNSSLDLVSKELNRLEKHAIDQVSWPEFSCQPQVHFAIAFSDDSLFLKFDVTENEIRFINTQPNSPVYEDSCVEFFISPDASDFYYNFEFNCIGTCLAAYGNSRNNRSFLSVNEISKIRTQSFIQKPGTELPFHWELVIVIPSAVFIHHPGLSFHQKTCSANFYKCGDALAVPHYLCWNQVDTPHPDFHTPHCFGKLHFG
jgi:hypothetical protein